MAPITARLLQVSRRRWMALVVETGLTDGGPSRGPVGQAQAREAPPPPGLRPTAARPRAGAGPGGAVGRDDQHATEPERVLRLPPSGSWPSRLRTTGSDLGSAWHRLGSAANGRLKCSS